MCVIIKKIYFIKCKNFIDKLDINKSRVFCLPFGGINSFNNDTISNLKDFLLTLPKVNFVRMTGSGSTIVAYFDSKKAVNIAARIFRRKYNNY